MRLEILHGPMNAPGLGDDFRQRQRADRCPGALRSIASDPQRPSLAASGAPAKSWVTTPMRGAVIAASGNIRAGW